MKYPIGIQTFEKIREDGYVYVDKTDMIYSLAQEGKIYFLSRPRRFGKSLLISTLENYFLGRKNLFEGLKIDALEKEWIEYPLFHIDFNDSDFTEDGVLEEVIDSYYIGSKRTCRHTLSVRYAASRKTRTNLRAGITPPETSMTIWLTLSVRCLLFTKAGS